MKNSIKMVASESKSQILRLAVASVVDSQAGTPPWVRFFTLVPPPPLPHSLEL
jgi:hypothetical protein